jgi:hypothetical protein
MTKNYRTISLAFVLVIVAFFCGVDFAGWLSGRDAITGAPFRSLHLGLIFVLLVGFYMFVAIVRSKDGLPWGGGPGNPY